MQMDIVDFVVDSIITNDAFVKYATHLSLKKIQSSACENVKSLNFPKKKKIVS